MATISLRCHTVDMEGRILPGGHCYMIFPEPNITAHDLLVEKVRAEFRKMRGGGGEHVASLNVIMGQRVMSTDPFTETAACVFVTTRFQDGSIAILVDDQVVHSLDYIISLTRRTGLMIRINDPAEKAKRHEASNSPAAIPDHNLTMDGEREAERIRGIRRTLSQRFDGAGRNESGDQAPGVHDSGDL